MDIPQVVIDKKLDSWQHKVKLNAEENRIVHSDDFIVTKTATGTMVSLKHEHKDHTPAWRYMGQWSDNVDYFPNDVVFIPSGVTLTSIAAGLPGTASEGTYLCTQTIPSAQTAVNAVAVGISSTIYPQYFRDSASAYFPKSDVTSSNVIWVPLGTGGSSTDWKAYDENAAIDKGTIIWVDPNKTYSISFFDTSSGGGPPLSAGAFFCVENVPDSGSRTTGNFYFPFYPTWDDSATVTISGSVKNQIFFRPIMPLSPQSFCTANGDTYSGFGVFIVTGSAFSFALPYP